MDIINIIEVRLGKYYQGKMYKFESGDFVVFNNRGEISGDKDKAISLLENTDDKIVDVQQMVFAADENVAPWEREL